MLDVLEQARMSSLMRDDLLSGWMASWRKGSPWVRDNGKEELMIYLRCLVKY